MNPFNTEQYLQKWIPLNEKMRAENFLWGTLFQNNEWHQYMSFDLYKMPKYQWDSLAKATQAIAHILQKTYQLISQDETLLLKIGLPNSAYNLKNVISPYFSYFTRLDLIVNGDNIKLIEVNCDTPTGYLETSICNRIICEMHHCQSPNGLEENIQQTWEQIKQDYAIAPTEAIYFTSYNWHDEDRETVQFIRNNCLNQKTRYIHIGHIVISADGIFTPKGEPIKFLYRLYPLEFFDQIDEEREQKVGHLFLEHIAEGRVKIINPPGAFFMQSKAVMALISSFLREKPNHFTKTELNWIDKYFLPTYFDKNVFEENNEAYVAKPLWGREGGGISLFDNKKNVVDEDRTAYYYQQKRIYQKYIEMPSATIGTWDGDYTGKLLIGSFLINGNPSGLFLRIGERITGNLSMFCGMTTRT
jgi:glutathionylspermidine synthase